MIGSDAFPVVSDYTGGPDRLHLSEASQKKLVFNQTGGRMTGQHHVAYQPIDKRSQSNMAPEIRVLHIRLEAWARWSREKVQNGWPERTILGRLIDEGPGAGHVSNAPTEIPDAIAEIDRAVAHLTGDDRRVIREYYLHWESREVLARRLRLTPKRMDGILNRARWRLVGFLSASLIPE